MADVDSEVINTLDALITTCKDGEKGYRDAAESVEDPELKEFLLNLSEQRAEFATELQSEVARLGGDPHHSGSPLGALHRGWIHLRDVLSGHDELATLSECERGDDTAMETYRNATTQSLPTDIQLMVRRHAAAIEVAHDRVKGLRNAAAAELI